MVTFISQAIHNYSQDVICNFIKCYFAYWFVNNENTNSDSWLSNSLITGSNISKQHQPTWLVTAMLITRGCSIRATTASSLNNLSWSSPELYTCTCTLLWRKHFRQYTCHGNQCIKAIIPCDYGYSGVSDHSQCLNLSALVLYCYIPFQSWWTIRPDCSPPPSSLHPFKTPTTCSSHLTPQSSWVPLEWSTNTT